MIRPHERDDHNEAQSPTRNSKPENTENKSSSSVIVESSSRNSVTLVSPSSTNGSIPSTNTQAEIRQNWRSVLGGFLSIAATLGVVTAVGLIQTHLEKHQLRSYKPRDVGWIAASNIFLILSVPVVAGPLFDRFGHRWLLSCGGILFLLGLLLTSYFNDENSSLLAPSVVLGVLLLSWGVLCGVGAGLVATTVTAAMNCWFDKRRGVACGSAFVGGSIGGVAWPLLLRRTFALWGWSWSLRMVAIIVLLLLILGNILMKAPQSYLANRDPEKPQVVSLRCLRQVDFLWLTLSLAFFQFIAMGIVGTLPSWAAKMGFDRDIVFNAVSAMNGGSAAGRIVIGALSDRIGRYKSVLLVQAIAICIIFAVFLNVGTVQWKFYLFAPLWGFAAGSILSMMSVLVGEVCEKGEFGMYYGTNSLIISIAGLFCVPLSAHVLVSMGPTIHVIVFGALCVLSTACLGVSRWAHFNRKEEGRGERQ